jgi:hypothetical protein
MPKPWWTQHVTPRCQTFTFTRPIVFCIVLLIVVLLSLNNVHEAIRSSRGTILKHNSNGSSHRDLHGTNHNRRSLDAPNEIIDDNDSLGSINDEEKSIRAILQPRRITGKKYAKSDVSQSTGAANRERSAKHSNRQKSSSQLQIAVYMTTHQSRQHMSFLGKCWPQASRTLSILQNATLIYYTSALHKDVPFHIFRQMKFRQVQVYHYQQLPIPPHATKLQINAKRQYGAKLAMVDPYVHHWFDEFDWIIRVNPDVLIRNDTWLMEQMMNPSIQAIVYGYPFLNGTLAGLHSDFYAFRPSIYHQSHITPARLQHHLDDEQFTAEQQLMDLIEPIYRSSTSHHHDESLRGITPSVAWIPGVKILGTSARMMGPQSPVIHIHNFTKYCPNYFHVTDGVWF